MSAAVVVAILALSLQGGPLVAQVYTYENEDGIRVYTDQKPDATRYDVRNIGCYGLCRKGVDWHSTPLVHELFAEEVRAAAEVFGIDVALVRAVMHVESWFRRDAVSHTGAQGLMQLMPATQRRFSVRDPFDPIDNITGGVAYLAWLMESFDNDLTRVIAAYNAGENAVREHDGVPPFSETREYVRRVNIMYRRYGGS